jgi:hypothetical protein
MNEASKFSGPVQVVPESNLELMTQNEVLKSQAASGSESEMRAPKSSFSIRQDTR